MSETLVVSRPRATWRTRAGVSLVRAYQLIGGPLAGGACRFAPSCSEYAREAIERHGFSRGLWLAVRRVARCHPLARPGWDPVPPPPAGE
jgi:hypothetical protein